MSFSSQAVLRSDRNWKGEPLTPVLTIAKSASSNRLGTERNAAVVPPEVDASSPVVTRSRELQLRNSSEM